MKRDDTTKMVWDAYVDATNCYLAGMGLPPLAPRCSECDGPNATIELGDERYCRICWSAFADEETPEPYRNEDERLDDPRRT